MNTLTAQTQLPVPKPSSPADILPQSSPAKLLTQTDIPIYVRVDDHANRFSTNVGNDHISTSDPLFLAPESAPHYARFLPPFTPGAQLAYSCHWELVQQLPLVGPVDFTRTVQWTSGASTTDITSFSAEIGASGAGLSTTLSASTSHSVTVSGSQAETQEFKFSVPEGETRVIAFWQLVETFALVDKDGKPLPAYSGLWRIHDSDGDGNQARAWFDAGQLVNRARTVFTDQTSFSPGA